jgi:quercetin dioxygenase-like cupin family protein
VWRRPRFRVTWKRDPAGSSSSIRLAWSLRCTTHHHTANHHVTVISGSITLTVGGKEHRLGPGAYFMLADRAAHIAKVEGKEDAVFFIQAEAPWDVVMAK